LVDSSLLGRIRPIGAHRKEAKMNHVQVVGDSGPLLDGLLEQWPQSFSNVFQTQLNSLDAAVAAIRERRPQWIVYCGGASAGSWSTSESEAADESLQVEQIVRAAVEVDARIVVISSDAVFSGPKLFHEENEPIPEDSNGRRLHAVEQLALNLAPQRVLVVRTHPFGWSRDGKSFAEQVWEALDGGEPVEVDAAAFATPILASDLGELLLRCVRARLQGLFHIGGAERTSQLRFALEMASIAGFDRRLVRSKPTDVLAADAARPHREMSLASRLVRRELGVTLPLLRESLLGFAEQASSGYRDRLRGKSQQCLARAA
jgi:dTDP-4-dehydrorhamnose reductase